MIPVGQQRLLHQAVLYATAEQYLAATTPFVAAGLSQGDMVLAATTKANAELLGAALGHDADRVVFLEQTQWYATPGRALAGLARALLERADSGSAIRVLSEPSWSGLDTLETAEWGRYESVVNRTFEAEPVRMLCGYDVRVLPEAIVIDARSTHPHLLTGEVSTVSEGFVEPEAYLTASAGELESPESEAVAVAFAVDPGPVRRFVMRLAPELGVPRHRLHDFVLAINEVTTNAIRHAGGYGLARIWRTGHRVVCEISDPGTVEQTFLGYSPGRPDADHGHGLWIARQLCDLVEIRTQCPGTKVRLHLRCPPDPGQSSIPYRMWTAT